MWGKHLTNDGIDTIEDETHFLLECSLYNVFRKATFDAILTCEHFRNLSKKDTLTALVNTHPRKSAKYILRAYLMRKSILYRK